MSDRDFEIGTLKFKLNKLDPFKQFHILRRLTPLLSDLMPVAQKLSGPNVKAEDQFEAFVPIFNGISKLSDEDANRVLLGLLSSVEVQQGQGNWAKVASDSNLMFQNIELHILLQVAGRAFGYNLKGFLAGLPQALNQGE